MLQPVLHPTRVENTLCVTPIFKSGNKVSVKNYRPISLLCIISKVFERIVFGKIYDHIASFIICSEQYGFLRKRSTIQQLLVHLHSLIDSVSSGHQSDVVYLDIKKAFDSVSHSIPLSCGQLGCVVLLGVSLWLIYLVADSVSVLATVFLICSLLLRGFLKAVSWVLFFLSCMSMTFRLFLFILLFCCLLMTVNAVETYSLLRIPSYCRATCAGCTIGVTPLVSLSDLCRLYDWSHSSGLIFNSSKSCVLSYHSPRSDPVIFDYSIGDQIIDRHSICKDLGVLFSDSLTWSSQVELVEESLQYI